MPKYDPSKQYKWEENKEFSLNGNQFGLVLNTLRNYLAKPESQEVIIMLKAEKEMTSLLAGAVEDGSVVEATPESMKEAVAQLKKT